MTNRIGAEVKRLRATRSTLWLEKATERLGFKVSRTSISQLENGNRTSISVAEWLVLAAALEVPPALLLYPSYPYGTVEYLPKEHKPAHTATDWISGRNSFIQNGLTSLPAPVVQLFTEIERLQGQQLKRILETIDPIDNPNAAKEITRLLKRDEEKISQLRQALYELTGELPTDESR